MAYGFVRVIRCVDYSFTLPFTLQIARIDMLSVSVLRVKQKLTSLFGFYCLHNMYIGFNIKSPRYWLITYIISIK